MQVEFSAAAQSVLDGLPGAYQAWVRDTLGRIAAGQPKPGALVRVLGNDVDLSCTVSECGSRFIVDKVEVRLRGIPR